MSSMYFAYGETELEYLRNRDERLRAVIDRVGHVDRAVDPDPFSSVIHHIIGQQISTKAQETVWRRMRDTLGGIAAGSAPIAAWRACISGRWPGEPSRSCGTIDPKHKCGGARYDLCSALRFPAGRHSAGGG